MRGRIAARLAQSLIVVFIATTISFFVIRLAPGDPFGYESPRITPAVRELWRHQYGYDRPLIEQYARYVTSIAQGKFGYSVGLHQPVSEAVASALPRTLLLTSVAFGLAFVLGMVVGVAQAARRGGWLDRLSTGVLVVLYSLPDFWAALMVLLLLAFWIPLFPASGMIDPVLHDYLGPWGRAIDRVKHLVLPAGTLTLLTMASIARYQRSAMLEVLPSDYIRTARANGVSERAIVWRHALRTALTPMVTLAGLLIPALLGGALFVEKVFAWPGMGMLAAGAIASRDYDLVTATVIVGSVLVVIGNLLADLLQMALDPRVRD